MRGRCLPSPSSYAETNGNLKFSLPSLLVLGHGGSLIIGRHCAANGCLTGVLNGIVTARVEMMVSNIVGNCKASAKERWLFDDSVQHGWRQTLVVCTPSVSAFVVLCVCACLRVGSFFAAFSGTKMCFLTRLG